MHNNSVLVFDALVILRIARLRKYFINTYGSCDIISAVPLAYVLTFSAR